MLTDLTTSAVGVAVDVEGARLHLSWTWLRDHARDEGSYLATTNQRLVTPDEVVTAQPGTATIAGDALVVTWTDGTTSSFSARFLGAIGDPRAVTVAAVTTPKRWTGTELAARLVRIDGGGVVDSDDALRTALHGLWRDGVVVIESVPATHAATRAVLERFGYLRSTIFGDLWEFRSDGGFDDTASTPMEITPHTDGTYSHDAPGLLGLHCHAYDANGGENVFVDAHALADRLSEPSLAVLRTVEIPGHYIGDGAHLMARRPALRYEDDRLVQVSYNHHDRAPFLLPEPAMSELYSALHEFDALAKDPGLQFELALRPGTMVVFDNWRVLHGRRAFRGERVIAGGYVNREDLESTTRRMTPTT